ncbi:MAG: FecR family protein [Melioribacteraceae bacterium]|nr:FecR family protein [Melioribacteraceae bacterium]MCF8265126.1 FecR family protein [Melioribacteraceae bacterium]
MKKLILLAFLLISMISYGQNSGVIEITVAQNENIRDISKKYLQKADYWQALLKINKLNGPSDVKPGVKIKIPVGDFRDANNAIDVAIKKINAASDAGAKLFSESLLSSAENSYNESLDLRTEGELKKSLAKANEAFASAEKAEKEALSKRSQKSSAQLTDKKGTVNNISPSQTVWSDLPLSGKLSEGEKVRTLSSSFAEITFEDQNRIKLNSNAQALIQTMRVDLLQKKKESSVKIVEGDAFAYLSGSAAKKQFDVKLDGVETKLDSRNFWVKKEKKATKIANYDGNIEIASGGETVKIGKNQKSTIINGQAPSKAENLLAAPKLIKPINSAGVSAKDLVFNWEPNPKAKGYLIEIASDANFKKTLFNEFNFQGTELSSVEMENGIYFWRVSAIDNEDFPGPFSQNASFIVSPESEDAYLVVFTPEDGTIVTTNTIEIQGKSEQNAQISINGLNVQLDDKNEFKFNLELNSGLNEINIKAVNKSQREKTIIRKVIFDLPKELRINFNEGLYKINDHEFLFNSNKFSIGGSARPNALVQIVSDEGNYKTYADDLGKFNFNMSQRSDSLFHKVSFITPSKLEFSDSVLIVIDKTPPVIVFDNQIPEVTNKSALEVSGSVSENSQLSIDNETVTMTANQFRKNLVLEPGENIVTLKAVDKAGNLTTINQIVKLDIEPPLLKDFKLNSQPVGKTSAITVRLDIEDSSPVKNTARLKVLFGKEVKFYYLRYIPYNKSYEGRVYNPSSEYLPRITSVIVEDYLGNKKEYHLTQ